MKRETSQLRTQLDRTDWITGAIETLADEGIAGMHIETLARRFGVTKGSFYWYFTDRQDLRDAVLQTWKEGRLGDINKLSVVAPGREVDQLRQIIEIYSTHRNRRGIAIELAIRDWGGRDARASSVVEEVDRHRLECARRLFVASGLSDNEAKSRSLLLYAYVFGQSLMASDRYGPKIIDFKHWISEPIVVT